MSSPTEIGGYLCSPNDLSPEQLRRLKANGVEFSEFVLVNWLGLNKGRHFLFSEIAFKTALELLGASIKSQEGPIRDLLLVELDFNREPQYCVRCCCWSSLGSSSAKYVFAATEILPHALQRDIVIHGCFGEEEKPEDPELADLELHLYSSPHADSSSGTPVPLSLWGIPYSGREVLISPSGLGKPIVESGGRVIGEIVGRHVYLFCNLSKSSDVVSMSIFECFCKAVVSILLDSGLGSDAISHEVSAKHREIYARICSRQVDIDLASMRNRLKAVRSEITELQAKCRRLYGEERALEEQIPAVENSVDANSEQFLREFDALRDSPMIAALFLDKDLVVVHTKTIYWLHPDTGECYLIGAMEFLFSLSPESGPMLTFRNLTHEVDGQSKKMHHPHIDSSGAPCWGNNSAQSTFERLVARGEIGAAISYVIQFVQSVNYLEAWGSHVCNWPLLTEDEVSRLKAEGELPSHAKGGLS